MSSYSEFFYKNLVKKIKFYRLKSGYTQEQLSEILGLNLKYIGHIERCERMISNKVIVELLELWHLQPHEFYDFDEKYDFKKEGR